MHVHAWWAGSDKSIGIVSLIGKDQSKLIQRKLLEAIGGERLVSASFPAACMHACMHAFHAGLPNLLSRCCSFVAKGDSSAVNGVQLLSA
jgi:hypothetical protein